MSTIEPLTVDERGAIELLGEVATIFSHRIVGNGPTREPDIAEFFSHVHDLQHAIMAQAAARTYGYRLLGQAFDRYAAAAGEEKR